MLCDTNMCSDGSLNKKTNEGKIYPGELTGNIDGLKALCDGGPDPWIYFKATIYFFLLARAIKITIVIFA